MSLKPLFQKINPGKLLGYGVTASASIPAAMDIFRMASGDMSASASFAQNFSLMAAGYGIAKSSENNTPTEASPAKAQVIIPRRDLVMIGT